MRQFDGKCPACGSRDVKRQFILQYNHSHLACACACCDYAWPALPLFEEAQEPQSEEQPEPPPVVDDRVRFCAAFPKPMPEPPLPMERGTCVSVAAGLYVERDSAGYAYRLSSKGAFTTKWTPWANLLILARWIIEQEEARVVRKECDAILKKNIRADILNRLCERCGEPVVISKDYSGVTTFFRGEFIILHEECADDFIKYARKGTRPRREEAKP